MINNKIVWLIIVLSIIVSAPLSYSGYQYCLSIGESIGYANGYTYNQDSYTNLGYESGKKDGYDNGSNDGYYIGYYDGWDEGERYAVSVLCPSSISSLPTSIYIDENRALSNPTQKELSAFLNDDKTENLVYSDEFNCWGFAISMKRHAESHGIRCAIVSMTYKDNIDDKPVAGHVINMFEVTDPDKIATYANYNPLNGGWVVVSGSPRIYVDAQNEMIVYDIAIGGSYRWYVDFSEFRRSDKMSEYNYYKRYGIWGDLRGRIQASNRGVDYIEPMKYIGDADDIKRYEDGPLIDSHDNISKIVIIW